MIIETIDDIVENLADQIGLYGSCTGDDCLSCRVHWVSDITRRIWDAFNVEKALRSIQGRT